MIRSDKMTIKTQEVLEETQGIATSMGHNAIEPDHLLRALLDQEGGVVTPVLQKIGVNLPQIRERVAASLKKLPQVSGDTEVYVSSALDRVLDAAQKEADKLKDDFVSTEHLLLGILADKGNEAARILTENGVTRELVLSALKDIRGGERVLPGIVGSSGPRKDAEPLKKGRSPSRWNLLLSPPP